MEKNKIKIVVLAAGHGKRMLSAVPKILISLHGKPLVAHILDAIKQSGIYDKPVVVVGQQRELVMKTLGNHYEYVIQEEQLGTGHAVSCAENKCSGTEHIVIFSGDQPFIAPETIKNLIERHLRSDAIITLTTTRVSDFADWRSTLKTFGRILRKNGEIVGIREYKDANETEKNIKEVNAGCYVFDAKWLWGNLKKLKNENTQKEYYLTDLIKMATGEKARIKSIDIDTREALGANSKEELDILENI